MQTAVATKPELPVRELIRDAALATAACANVLICFSGRTPNKRYLDSSAQAILSYAKDYPQGLGMLVLISQGEPPPDEQGRRVIIATRDTIKQCVRASVLVVEGQGFAASAKRSVVAMFSLASSLPFPEKVAGSISEGAAKLAKLLGPQLDPRLDAAGIAAAASSVHKLFST